MSKKSIARVLFFGILLIAENLGLEMLFHDLPDVIGYVIRVLLVMGTFYLLIQVNYAIEIPINSPVSTKEQVRVNWLTILLVIGCCLPLMFKGMMEYPASLPDSLLYAMGAGIVGEYLFRGLFLQLALEDGDGSYKQVLLAVLLSSLFFGLVQLTPYLEKSLVTLANQGLYAFCLGVYLCALVVRTGHIWWGILLQYMMTFSLIQASQSTLTTPASVVWSPLFSLILLALALYLMRQQKVAVDAN